MLERTIIQEKSFSTVMSVELAQQWADGIPTYSESDPNDPEWRKTPVEILPTEFGDVYIKDESDKRSNPTGTIKDRPAWEMACLYRDFARHILLKVNSGILSKGIGRVRIPRLTYVTAGNIGLAFANRFKIHGLPPMKILIDNSMPKDRVEKLKELHADIYMVDLNRKELSPEEIKMLTNNQDGIDITSVRSLELTPLFYDWHVHESFNFKPDFIYTPAGSLSLMGCYLFHQQKNLRKKDPRLEIPLERLSQINILGAMPKSRFSVADKLVSDYLPFAPVGISDVDALKSLKFTGEQTGIYRVREDHIRDAYAILSGRFNCEPSSAAGLALFLQMGEQGLIDKNKRHLIINTGRGI